MMDKDFGVARVGMMVWDLGDNNYPSRTQAIEKGHKKELDLDASCLLSLYLFSLKL